jgi:predicted MFS family arabinose efflux permease
MAAHFQFWGEGLTFIGLMLFIVGVPCVAVSVLGTRLIDHIGQYPTKSARLQMAVCIQLLVVEIFSFLMLAMFFHIFSD